MSCRALLFIAMIHGCGGATDTTLDVPQRQSSSIGVSPDSDLCKVDAEACRAKRPIDQCLLECKRSGCADDIGGGCRHACGLRGARPEERDALLQREAAAYRAGTAYFCRRKAAAR